LPLLIKKLKLEEKFKLKIHTLISQVLANFTKVNRIQKSQSLPQKLKREKLKLRSSVALLKRKMMQLLPLKLMRLRLEKMLCKTMLILKIFTKIRKPQMQLQMKKLKLELMSLLKLL